LHTARIEELALQIKIKLLPMCRDAQIRLLSVLASCAAFSRGGHTR
jgi:hypothetical protein